MEHLLSNPVYHALNGIDAHLGNGAGYVKYFDEAVSPFAGFPDDYEKGFEELHQLLPADRKIIYANPQRVKQPKGWKVLHEIP